VISTAFGAVLVAVLSAPGIVASVQPASAPTAVRANDVAIMLSDLNTRRTAVGLPSLALDPQLCQVAREHALDMAERGYFDHVTPEGESPFDRLDRAHIRFSWVGENIALDGSPTMADHDWWNSLEHRSNMLQPHFARVGIAAVPAPDGELFVEDFSD
jgi:uncharacterized protein YkwD